MPKDCKELKAWLTDRLSNLNTVLTFSEQAPEGDGHIDSAQNFCKNLEKNLEELLKKAKECLCPEDLKLLEDALKNAKDRCGKQGERSRKVPLPAPDPLPFPKPEPDPNPAPNPAPDANPAQQALFDWARSQLGLADWSFESVGNAVISQIIMAAEYGLLRRTAPGSQTFRYAFGH